MRQKKLVTRLLSNIRKYRGVDKIKSKQLQLLILAYFVTFLLLNSKYALLVSGDAGPAVLSSDGNFNINTWDDDWVTQTEVEDFAEVLEDAYEILVGDWGFPDPMTTSNDPPIEVEIEQTDGYNGWACCLNRENSFEMGFYPDYLPFAPDHEPLKVAGHELFHCCQFVHPDTPPKLWVLEGMARMSQDKYSDWLDHADGTEAGSSFVRQSKKYLENSHTSDLTSLSYDGCLFWAYFCEQFGSDTTDPDYGMDAITTFWDTSINPTGSDGITMTQNALNALNPGMTFDELFQDFSMAIYAKDFATATVPSKWTFVDDDETDGSGEYGFVSKEIDSAPTLSDGDSYTSDSTIRRLANKYFEIEVDPSVEVVTLQFNQTTHHPLFYGVVCSKGDDVDYYYTVTAQDFQRAIINDNYDKICVVVAGTKDMSGVASFDYGFYAGSPNISIMSPQDTPETAQARVGPHDQAEKFIAIVDLYFKGAPIHGFVTENFKATIGTEDAPVLSATDVYGKYFLLINAPNQATDGLYNLDIDLIDSNNVAITSDSSEKAVFYGDRYYDLMLSIDRSGSMYYHNKMLAAKSASKLFVNSFLEEDLLGVVSFADAALIEHELKQLTTSNRDAAITKIDAITAGGFTSIGDSLQKCQNQFNLNGMADLPDHIILLSDGHETTDPWIADVLPTLLDAGTIVHVVTIGADAAFPEMQNLAADTGGLYFHCFDPASGDIPNDLAELYRDIVDFVKDLETFFQQRGTISSSASKTFSIPVSDDMDMVEFVTHYNATEAPTTLTLQDPDLNLVSETHANDRAGMGHKTWQVKDPKPGKWTITLEAPKSTEDLKYYVEASANTVVTLRLLSPPNGYISAKWSNAVNAGVPIPFLVSMTDKGVITGAKVTLNVIPPSYKTNNDIHKLQLYDDGNHGDGLANDGIYGNLFTATSEIGSYQYSLNAMGEDNSGNKFTRTLSGAFHVYIDQKRYDDDEDMLPTVWERFYGLDPFDPTGEHGFDGDPDLDGLSNGEELYWGTNPLLPDTDFGGQTDGSEVTHNTNPLIPDDDAVLLLPAVRVYPGNSFTYILMPPDPLDYDTLQIYRSTNPKFGYTRIASGTFGELGTYNDTTVNNYQTYYYRIIPTDKSVRFGNIGRFIQVGPIIPKQNVQAAEACVLINNGSKATDSNGVDIRIIVTKNDLSSKNANLPTHMRYSETIQDLYEEPWDPFDSNFSIILDSLPGTKFVYVQLKDSQPIPEISPIFSAGIVYTGGVTETPTDSSTGVTGTPSFGFEMYILSSSGLVAVEIIRRRRYQ